MAFDVLKKRPSPGPAGPPLPPAGEGKLGAAYIVNRGVLIWNRIGWLLFFSFLALVYGVGLMVAQGHYYAPGSSLGYNLGLLGGSLMLLLLLYPLRKHARFMRSWGPMKPWFRAHMICGVAGPVLVLFHSTFQIDSLNAAVAMTSMLLVAGSGVVGRYVYTRIHHGLYGRQRNLQELQAQAGAFSAQMAATLSPDAHLRLQKFQQAAATASGFWARLWRFVSIRARAYLLYRRLRPQSDGQGALAAYLDGVVDLAQFRTYERIFSLWHVLHIPLVLLLLLSGVFHVLAVHMY